ncbi:hypothetical protein [Bizionia sp.]|uniref:hypothetical protein n=1 Tax=Bizionia sp. TaxID=1954480 RepID=UPI003A909B75
MKKYISILMIALVVLSCSKSDDDNDVVPEAEHKIVGKWQLIEINDEGAGWEVVDNNSSIEFTMNGSVIVIPDLSGESCEFRTYQVSLISNADDELTYFCNGEVSSTITFSFIEDNQLILKSVWSQSKFIRIPNQE